MSDHSLLPDGLDYEAVAPFIYLTLAAMYMVGFDPVVKQYGQASPAGLRAIRELNTAVARAGVRVRTTGRMHSEFDERLSLFTAEEIWLFDLAIDVLAMFASSGGLAPGTQARMISDLRSLDDEVHTHHWKSQVRKADPGPAQFQELRAHIPRHKPHPDSFR